MRQVLFVIAMEKEAIDIKNKLGLEKVQDNMYRKENISLLVTGIGKQQTAIRLTQYLEHTQNKPDVIINIGYAGSTNSKIGEWVNVSKSFNYEWMIPGEQQYIVEGFDDDRIKTIQNEDNAKRTRLFLLLRCQLISSKDNANRMRCLILL